MLTRDKIAAAMVGAGLLCVCASADVYASGFAIAEQGASSSALGNAATARGDLPEAGFYNPAGYALGDEPLRLRFGAGASVLSPTIEHTGAGGDVTRSQGGLTPIPRMHLGVGVGKFATSLSIDAPFGSSVTWPDGWDGRYELERTSLSVLELGLNAAFAPTRVIALSGGVRFQSSTLGIARAIDVVEPGADGGVEITAAGTGVGWGASLLFMPIEPLTMGLSFRSRSTHAMSGSADFRDIPIELEDAARDTKVSTTFVMPGRFALGAAWDFGPGVLSVDMEHWAWATTQELVLDFEDEGVADVTQPRRWRPSFAGALGYEHRLLGGEVLLRAGGRVDATPVPVDTLGPSSPDGLRASAALGGGWRPDWGGMIDLSAGYTSIGSRETSAAGSLPGSYAGGYWSLALDVGFRLE